MKRYLFYVAQVYSLAILRPLQRLILERGDEAAWFFERLEAGADHLLSGECRLTTVAEVKDFKPHAVFVPGNDVPDFFPGAKVQLFHGLANDETGKKGHYRIRGFFDLYCTHAPGGTRKFSELARKHSHFRVAETGWPKVDPLFNPDGRSDWRRRMGISKPVVFYASTFSPSLTSAPFLAEEIARLAGNGRWHWLVTLHPKTEPQVAARYRQLAGPNLTFFESSHDVLPLLQAGDIMLCDTSSIALEFMLLDKPVVTFRTRVPGPHVIDVRQPGDIEAALAHALTRPDSHLTAMRTYIDRLHPYRDGRSSERVLQAVHELVDAVPSAVLSKPFNLFRRCKIRRRLGYYHWR